ncbi:glycogen synthase GlgA [Dongia deserti]|uniref:glycogen synthase GlgA n=1 Tax=Dongia deserti TaxID=2268030 RepID=UPI000E65956C|nr:glycogen synthase GlgA [Dongia deserti]
MASAASALSIGVQATAHSGVAIGAPSRVLYVTPETSDFVKAGGLGDVSAALPRALRGRCDVRVLLPGYRQVLQCCRTLEILGRLEGLAGIPQCDIAQVTMADGLVAYIVLAPSLYDRDGTPYGGPLGDWSDNDVRFARLALAAVEIAGGKRELGWRPDLLHLNDWPTALAAGYAAWRDTPVPSLLTIHNLAYQGLFGPDCLDRLGIPAGAFNIDGVEFHGKVSFLKAGISFASEISTVSATYAQEITTAEFGCGLDGLLKLRAEEGRLTGIINGIDPSWDPSRGAGIASPFDARDLRGKGRNAEQVRSDFKLAVSRGPLFAVVSRLVHQKGLDLMIGAAETVVRLGGQIAIMGQGEPTVERELGALAKRHPGDISLKVGFDGAEARCMFAGSDFLLMPSRFEPCGLSQMYAQRFGSLPIARKTGGLADSIEDGRTGFLFRAISVEACLEAITRAFNVFGNGDIFMAMRRLAMARNFSWTKPAASYQAIYARAINGLRTHHVA